MSPQKIPDMYIPDSPHENACLFAPNRTVSMCNQQRSLSTRNGALKFKKIVFEHTLSKVYLTHTPNTRTQNIHTKRQP